MPLEEIGSRAWVHVIAHEIQEEKGGSMFFDVFRCFLTFFDGFEFDWHLLMILGDFDDWESYYGHDLLHIWMIFPDWDSW